MRYVSFAFLFLISYAAHAEPFCNKEQAQKLTKSLETIEDAFRNAKIPTASTMSSGTEPLRPDGAIGLLVFGGDQGAGNEHSLLEPVIKDNQVQGFAIFRDRFPKTLEMFREQAHITIHPLVKSTSLLEKLQTAKTCQEMQKIFDDYKSAVQKLVKETKKIMPLGNDGDDSLVGHLDELCQKAGISFFAAKADRAEREANTGGNERKMSEAFASVLPAVKTIDPETLYYWLLDSVSRVIVKNPKLETALQKSLHGDLGKKPATAEEKAAARDLAMKYCKTAGDAEAATVKKILAADSATYEYIKSQGKTGKEAAPDESSGKTGSAD